MLLFKQRLRITIKLAFATDENVIAELNKELKKQYLKKLFLIFF